MKNVYKLILASLIICCTADGTFAQNDLSNFLQAKGEDASKLMEAYIKPAVTSISYGMTGGWYNTAKPHKTLGFDIGATVTLAFIPKADNYFNPQSFLSQGSSPTTFNNIDNPGKGAPTIFGPKDETQYSVTYTPSGSNQSETFKFKGPEGLDIKKTIHFAALPVPMAQIGIGIYKGTDLKFRIVPEQNFDGNKVKMLGFGVLHDVKQHIPVVKNLPFDLSALVAYNRVTSSSDLTNTSGSYPSSSDGKFDSKLNSWVIQGIVSKKISVLTGYVGVGYSIVQTKAHVLGTYTIMSESDNTFDVTNPVNIDFKNNSPRLTAGIRLKFGPLYFVGDYTVQKYNALTVGMGFAVR